MDAPLENKPAQWLDMVKSPLREDNKYSRGHVLVVGGPRHMTGAARLAALAALRIGAGLVTIAAKPSALDIYAAHLTTVMMAGWESPKDIVGFIKRRKVTAVLLGPGFGVGQECKDLAETLAALKMPLVLDADALTSLAPLADSGLSFDKKTVLTPHEGEFARLFPELKGRPRGKQVLEGAVQAGCTLLLKGAGSLISAGQSVILNDHDDPNLATAGTGDVLAGMVTGLMAKGVPPIKATAAATWIHGEAGKRLGQGLIAEDLPQIIGSILKDLQKGD